MGPRGPQKASRLCGFAFPACFFARPRTSHPSHGPLVRLLASVEGGKGGRPQNFARLTTPGGRRTQLGCGVVATALLSLLVLVMGGYGTPGLGGVWNTPRSIGYGIGAGGGVSGRSHVVILKRSRKLRWLGNAVAVSTCACGLQLSIRCTISCTSDVLASFRVQLAGVGRHGQELRSFNGRPETRPRLQNTSLHVPSHS